MNKLEKNIGIAMRVGVITALVLIVVGLVLVSINGESELPQSQQLTLDIIVAAFSNWSPWAIVSLGIFVLILTPILRVIVSIISFAAERDKLYVVITSGVLLILIISFMIAILWQTLG